MNQFQKNLFNKIQDQANIGEADIFSVADALQNADFADEETVRNLVRQLGTMVNKPVSEEKESRIVDAIVNKQNAGDLESLKNLFNQS